VSAAELTIQGGDAVLLLDENLHVPNRSVVQLSTIEDRVGYRMRQYLRNFAVGISLVAMPIQASAATYLEPARIIRVGVDKDGIAYIKTDSATVAGQTPAACSTQGYWQAAFNSATPAGQAMLSVALAAKLANASVRIVGTGACSVHPSIEVTLVVDIL
jgi:hypothetical protein